jgi:hypothetical protein
MFRIFLLLVFLMIFVPLSAQDTVRMYQKDAALFSNCYSLFYDSTKIAARTFEHVIMGDAGEMWLGGGTYRESKKKYTLTYDPDFSVDELYRGRDNSLPKDALKITWIDDSEPVPFMLTAKGVSDTVRISAMNGEVLLTNWTLYSSVEMSFLRDTWILKMPAGRFNTFTYKTRFAGFATFPFDIKKERIRKKKGKLIAREWFSHNKKGEFLLH